MLPPWFGRRDRLAASAAEALPRSLAAGRVVAWLRPLFSAERPDLRFFEALACLAAAPSVPAGRYRRIAARAGWLPWFDPLLVGPCVAHLRTDAVA